MVAADLLTTLLVAGVVVLVVSSAIMGMGVSTSVKISRRRRQRKARPTAAPSAAKTLELAKARAAANEAEALRALAAAPQRVAIPAGQVIDISDGRQGGREMSVEYAHALARHLADTDPQRVAEVVNQWIRADSTDPLDLFR